MKTQMHWYGFFGFAILVAWILLRGAASHHDVAQAQKENDEQSVRLITSLKGPDLYRAHCAPCHGNDAKGNGPVASALRDSVPDLTTIARRNGGLFPADRVRNLISGDEVLAVHGSREMPVWGPIFHQVENDRDYGNVRLKNLTEYLRSIQQK
jgi:mono/diheme cytochrome c family protein